MAEFFQWLSSGSLSAIIFILAVATLLLTVALIYFVAFLQGREIAFWPPKIGTKPVKPKGEIEGLISQEEVVLPLAYVFGTEPPFWDKEIENFTNFYVLGMNLRRTLTSYYDLLERKLMEGGELKFLLVDPNSEAIRFIAHRNYVYRDPDKLRAIILSTLETLEQLRSAVPHGNLEVRVFSNVPSFGLTLLDVDRPRGKIRVDLYPYRVPPATYPSFWVKREVDKKWFDFFRNQFFNVWKDGYPYLGSRDAQPCVQRTQLRRVR